MGDTLYLEPEQLRVFWQDIYTLKLRKVTHEQLKLMFEVLLYGAMRISEVLQITPSDLIDGKIRLKVTKGGTERCKCSRWSFRPTRLVSSDRDCAKCGGMGRYRIDVFAYVLPEVYDELQELAKTKKPGDLLFPITRSRAWQYVDQLLGGRTHTFRHTWLTRMLETEKFNIRDIKQKARHKSLATTSKYIEDNQDVTRKKEAMTFERI